MDSQSALPQLIGGRVARRRAALGLPLEGIALRTGVSCAMVSRIDRGEVHASTVLLDKLCAGFGMSQSALFARHTAPLLRRADQPVWRDPASGYRRREVAPAGTGSAVRIAEIEFPPDAEVAFDRRRQRPIDQHVWVLEGEIEVASAGAVHTLAAGDRLHLRSADNTFRNVGDGPARYAVVLAVEPFVWPTTTSVS